jgi:hypothetical protein
VSTTFNLPDFFYRKGGSNLNFTSVFNFHIKTSQRVFNFLICDNLICDNLNFKIKQSKGVGHFLKRHDREGSRKKPHSLIDSIR